MTTLESRDLTKRISKFGLTFKESTILGYLMKFNYYGFTSIKESTNNNKPIVISYEDILYNFGLFMDKKEVKDLIASLEEKKILYVEVNGVYLNSCPKVVDTIGLYTTIG